MLIGKVYTFEDLEEYLSKWKNRGVYLIVENTEVNERAVMHVFNENFAEKWLSGDGVLFYSDGEAHSANKHDEFLLIDIKKIK